MITHSYDKEIKLSVNSFDFDEGENVNVTLKLQDFNEQDVKVITDTTSIKNSVAKYPFVIKDLIDEVKLDQVKYVKGWIDTNGDGKLSYDEEVKLKVDNGYKIRLIFKAAQSDIFIDKFESLDLSNLNVSLYDLKDQEHVKDLHEHSVGMVEYTKNEQNKAKEGFLFELPLRYAGGAYKLEFTYKEKSVLFPIEFALHTKDKALTSLHKIKNNSIQLMCNDSNLFQDEQSREEYIDITVTLGVNIIIDCTSQGASNTHLFQKDEMRTVVVPMTYKSKYYTQDTGKEDFEPNGERTKENAEFPSTKEITQEHYPSLTIQRANSNFEEFLDPGKKIKDDNDGTIQLDKDGSINFKIVNYRKSIYTGDKKHQLNGDGWMEGPRGKRKHHKPFETGIEEKKFVHTEYIESRIYVLLEVKGVNYLFTKDPEIEKILFKKEDGITSIQDIPLYKKKTERIKDLYRYSYANSLNQIIYLHLGFDGKEITYKDTIVDNISFKDDGTFKSIIE
ncbi:hypothetical protein [Sulfurimonas sp.]|uniref:hypothetical protein n=1 Tax=Sulfurimonas sp. TaxID=2022749 RepID=UPI003D133F7E